MKPSSVIIVVLAIAVAIACLSEDPSWAIWLASGLALVIGIKIVGGVFATGRARRRPSHRTAAFCFHCGHSLRGAVSNACPECGGAVRQIPLSTLPVAPTPVRRRNDNRVPSSHNGRA